ncbi:MAG TPA: hypothetical protein PK256_15625 [Verrucomicrobiota bacterium]|nr:hypothetical protein [Verrucomicrobiota bacterium]
MVPELGAELHTLAENVNVPGLRIVVFNPLPWPRDGLVDFAFPFMGSIAGKTAVKSVDNGAVQALQTWGAHSHRNGRFVAKNVPPLGYKTYIVTSDEPKKTALAGDPQSAVIDLQMNIVHHLATENPEAGWLCLPFAISDPQFHLRTPGAITVTAFGPNPDGAGTLLRLWEQSGTGGALTVTLPSELKATKAQPANLRGEESGQPIAITDHQLTFHLAAYAPASFILQCAP